MCPLPSTHFLKPRKRYPHPKRKGWKLLNRFMCLSTDPISDVEFYISIDLWFRSDMVHPVGKSSVNSGRLHRDKSGHVSDFLGYQLIWCSMISWAFWHLLYWNRPKNETVLSKKLNRMRGVCGDPENDNVDQISYFTPYCVDFSAVSYLFVVKESICERFKKIGPSVFVKMAV